MDKLTLVLIVLGVLLVTNLTCFLLMGKDKKAAKKNEWRVKERTLFLSCALFGALGGVLGMSVFHHKTRHWYFRLFFPLMLVLQLAALIALGILYAG